MQRMWIISFFILSMEAHAQRNAKLFEEGDVKTFHFQDTLQLVAFLQEKQIGWIEDGYFFAGIDSLFEEAGGEINVYLHKGRKYRSKIFKKRKVLSSVESSLDDLVNNGHPFASIEFDSLAIEGDEVLVGTIRTREGPEIRIDSLFISGDINTNSTYVSNLLELKPGDLFSENAYRLIESRIKRSSFLRLNHPQDVAFQDGKATIFLDLSKTNTNQFEGIIGLQQNRNGGSTAVGSLRLDTDNLFRSGHQFNFLWERFSEASQTLNLHYKHAFLFGSSISPSFRFDLLRQDTSFITRTSGIGINMFVFSNVRLSVNFESINATLLANDVEVVQGRALADYQRSFYRLELAKGYASLLSTFTEGIAWRFSMGAGNKKINRNLSLPESYYDSIDLNTDFLELTGKMSYQLKIDKRNAIFHQMDFGVLYNDELLTNELYRIGGLRSVRGFNEKEFFARRYFSSSIELRSFFESNSYFYLFYDHLFYKGNRNNDDPFGLGLGFALETQSGQFNFAFASGDSNQQSISLDQLRVHFGYVANF